MTVTSETRAASENPTTLSVAARLIGEKLLALVDLTPDTQDLADSNNSDHQFLFNLADFINSLANMAEQDYPPTDPEAMIAKLRAQVADLIPKPDEELLEGSAVKKYVEPETQFLPRIPSE